MNFECNTIAIATRPIRFLGYVPRCECLVVLICPFRQRKWHRRRWRSLVRLIKITSKKSVYNLILFILYLKLKIICNITATVLYKESRKDLVHGDIYYYIYLKKSCFLSLNQYQQNGHCPPYF